MMSDEELDKVIRQLIDEISRLRGEVEGHAKWIARFRIMFYIWVVSVIFSIVVWLAFFGIP